MNFNTGEITDGQILAEPSTQSVYPYTTTNIYNYTDNQINNPGSHVTVERTEDVLTNLFMRSGGGRNNFIFQPNSAVDDYCTAALSDTSFSGVPITQKSMSFDINVEEVYL